MMGSNAGILYLILAYLIGSVPTAVMLSKLVFGSDIRQLGSKNAGATNMMRNFGVKAGAMVLVADILKGFLAVQIPQLATIAHLPAPYENQFRFALVLSLSAAVGHIFPLFAGFRGGKGVATLLGCAFGIDWLFALMCLGVFAVVMLVSRIVSLASMLAAVSFFPLYVLRERPDCPNLILAGTLTTLVLLTHRTNITRLVSRTEKKFKLPGSSGKP